VTPALSLLLLTEDGSGNAHAVQERMVKAMLRLIDPMCRLEDTHAEFEPPTGTVANLVRGSQWKSRRNAIDLARVIAGKLSEANGFVVFHIDADVPWPRRSANVEQFKSLLVVIRQHLHGAKDRPAPSQVEARARKLCLVVPHFELEAWLYQSTDAAIRLCHEHHGGRDAEKFTRWRDDRASLDREPDTKDRTVLRDGHNLALAGSFPARDVFWAGASFTRAVCWLARTEGLVDALARTRA